jgi:outer membrane immunogenic protein
MFLAGVSALAVLATIGGANAADLGRRYPAQMPVKAEPVYAAYNWTGFYLGINGGGAWGKSNFSDPFGTTGDFNLSGAMIGGTAGYNWQAGRAVFGVEGDIDWSTVKGSTNADACVGGPCETKNPWFGTARGRVGYAFDRVMPYVTGGLAFGGVKANTAGGSVSETRAGWTVGGGVEAAIAGPLTAKIEYLYADLGKMNCGAPTCTAGGDVKFNANIVRAGLNYRF